MLVGVSIETDSWTSRFPQVSPDGVLRLDVFAFAPGDEPASSEVLRTEGRAGESSATGTEVAVVQS